MQNLINGQNTKIGTAMNEVRIYERLGDGNRGKLLFTSKYPNKNQAMRAKSAYIHLCINQKRYAKEWNLKNVIID